MHAHEQFLPRPAEGPTRDVDPGRALEAWHRFAHYDEPPGDAVPPPIARAWARARAGGCDPHLMRAHVLAPPEAARLLHRQGDLIQAAAPYLRALSMAAGAERHAAMLGDARGVVLDVLGDERSVHGPESVPGPGSSLAEAVAGANGIGTPLADGSYAELVGAEHFIHGFHAFTCQGIPLQMDSTTVGVLSTSVRRVETGRRLREILVCSAHGIEAEMLRRQLERDVKDVLGAEGPTAAVLEQLRQDVVQMQTAARLRLQVAARTAAKRGAQDARDLVQAAGRLAEAFHWRASLWRELAGHASSSSQRVSLGMRVTQLVELLQTEAACQHKTLAVAPAPEAPVDADPQQLSRDVFRLLMEALESAPKAGAVGVEVVVDAARKVGAVQVHPGVTLADGAAGFRQAWPLRELP